MTSKTKNGIIIAITTASTPRIKNRTTTFKLLIGHVEMSQNSERNISICTCAHSYIHICNVHFFFVFFFLFFYYIHISSLFLYMYIVRVCTYSISLFSLYISLNFSNILILFKFNSCIFSCTLRNKFYRILE